MEKMKEYIAVFEVTFDLYPRESFYVQEHTAVVDRVHARKGLNFRAKNAENAKKRIRKIVKEIRRRHELFFYEYEDDAYEYYEDWGEIWLYSLDKYYGYTGKCNERGVVEIMHELIEFR